MNCKKSIPILLVMTILLSSLLIMPVSAENFNYLDGDNISDWAVESVEEATKLDFISGFKGEFRPKSNITRAEFIKIVNNILGIKELDKNTIDFLDVRESDWFYSTINTAFNSGIIEGSGNRINPNDNISREEMATILSRALKLEKKETDRNIKDLNKASEWSKSHIEIIVSNNIIIGDIAGNFNPKILATREMGIVSAMRAYNIKNNTMEDTNPESIAKFIDETGKFMYTKVENPIMNTLGGDWTILGLGRGNIDVPEGYYDKYYKNVEKYIKEKDGILDKVKYTEYDRLILALTSINKDVTDIAGYNLLKPLADYDVLIRQGINGPVFALLALDSKDYEIPIEKDVKTQTTRELLVRNILDREIDSGGWAYSSEAKKADPDMTSMVLQSLAPYYSNNIKVKEAVDRGVNILSELQQDNGGYISWGSENSESSSQVIVALTSLGIDPHNDKRFIKNGNSALDGLLRYKVPAGGFYHVLPGNPGVAEGNPDLMGTDQGMYALVAYNRFINNKNRLYDMTDVK